MLLPCPHCRSRHRLHVEQVLSERIRIQCPACGGAFVVNLNPSTRSSKGSDGPLDSLLSLPSQFSDGGEDDSRDPDVSGAHIESRMGGGDASGIAYQGARSPLETEAVTTRHVFDRERPKFLLFWTLVPACCLLLALTGILVSGPWVDTGPSLREPSSAEFGADAPLSSSVSSHPRATHHRESPGQDTATQSIRPDGRIENPMAHAFWVATSEAESPCEVLARLQSSLRETGGEAPCQLYPLMISYLVLETEPVPVCELEPTFALATEAIHREVLCGPGHAFLAAYYLKKGLLDRSQSFLDQALRLAPEDPWVKLVEALFYEEAYYDDQKVISVLEGLTTDQPSFPLVQYLLGKAYLRQEEYREANAAFESLKEEAKGQIAFWRIRRALSSLEQTADPGAEQAEALLALSRAFATLKDYSMAQDLYRRVLEEMPGSLQKTERMSAYCELGRIYEKGGDNSSAYDAYRTALEMDPEYPAAREGIRDLLPDPSNHS